MFLRQVIVSSYHGDLFHLACRLYSIKGCFIRENNFNASLCAELIYVVKKQVWHNQNSRI